MFDPDTGKAYPHQAPPPAPDPMHQRKITREKWFEIVTVVLLIAGGMGFLAWRSGHHNHSHGRTDGVDTVAEAATQVTARGFVPTDTEIHYGRAFNGYAKSLKEFTCSMDLIGLGDKKPLETAVFWLNAQALEPVPSEQGIQDAVNEVAHMASTLVPAAEKAIQHAVRTSKSVGDAKRPLDKGVAGTSDGWKVTYVTYKSFEELHQPVLVLVLQSLEAGSDPELGEFNRVLYRAVEEGVEVRQAFHGQGPETAARNGERNLLRALSLAESYPFGQIIGIMNARFSKEELL